LVCYAHRLGVDFERVRNDSLFEQGQRWIFLWRKRNELPSTGPAKEADGTLHYNMQGTISALPTVLKESASAFRGAWSEAGTFKDLDQAFALVKAWLLDRKEVDELPGRSMKRYQI
jgi:hypothetical protein